ncbi:MAG: response regulator transcription factor [Firmicutes bacterium]|nr:response regulator transcription factor [Bacillota bacterium]
MRALVIINRDSPGNKLHKMVSELEGIKIVAQSAEISSAADLCAIHGPDLVIVDAFPKGAGISRYIAGIKRDFPGIKVFVLTCAEDDDLAEEARAAGADIVALSNITMEGFQQLLGYSQKHYRVFPCRGPAASRLPCKFL